LTNPIRTASAPSPRLRFVLSASPIKTLPSLLATALLVLLTLGSDVPVFAATQKLGSLPVNSSSSTTPVTVTIPSGGVLSEVRVVTQGLSNADFTLSSPGTCGVGTTFAAPSSCTLSVSFQPKAPGTRLGAVVLISGTGSVLGAQGLTGVGDGSVSVFTPATMVTVAGNGQWLYTGDGGAATNSSIFLPGGVAVDPAGSFYIADSGNNRIRKVAIDGTITTVAGSGSPSSANDGALAVNAGVSDPGALLLDGSGDLYIADSSNHAIRKLSLATGRLTTVAGQLNQQGYSGDGGPATAATLNTPEGLAFDPNGNLYIADTKNHVIRKLDISTGLISTYAGLGTQPGYSGDGGTAITAHLNGPWGLATDTLGDLFIADLNNNRIRKVAIDGTITTVVGTGTNDYAVDGQSGPATAINNPAAVAVDVAGNLYVADSGHNIVRKMNAVTGITTAIAGTGNPTFMGDDGAATLAGLYGPYALTLDSLGNLYVADIFHHRIREVQNTRTSLSFQPIRVGRTSPSQPQIVENDGNRSLNFTGINPDSNSSVDAAATTCAAGTPLAVDATCVIGAQFSPQVTGTLVTAFIQAQSDAANSPGTIKLSGEVDELEPTRTSIVSGANPSALGHSLSFTASVTGNATQPSGSIRFYDGNTLLGSSATDSTGTAIFTTSTLTLGSHAITANFTGDAVDSPSVSPVLTQVVKRAATLALSSPLNPSKVGNSVTFSVTVSASGAQPTGTVLFSDGATAVATVAVQPDGTAAYTVSSLPAGIHTLSAAYSGDTTTLSGSSSPLSHTVEKWSSTTTLSSPNASTTVGSPVTFSISVTPTSTVAPTGTVVLKDGATVLSTLTLDGSGSASYQISSLAVGNHTLTASFPGDATNDISSSAGYQQVIQQVATATTLASSANPSNGGATLHLSAKVSASSTNDITGPLNGTVTFKDGSTVLGSGTLAANGTYTLDISTLTVANHVLVATYNGITNYAVSSSAALNQQVVLATTSVQLTSSANPAVAGNNISLTAVVTGNGSTPTGKVSFFDGSVSLGSATLGTTGQASLTLGNLSSGDHLLTVSYAGDAADTSSVSAAVTQTVKQATTAITLASSSNPSIAGTSLTFTANLSSNGSLPTGSLSLHDGSTVIGNALIGPTGAAKFTLDTLSPQTHTLTAFFAGDSDHLANTSVALVQQIQLATSTAAVVSSQSPGVLGSAVTFTARVGGTGIQPTGNVIFLDGTTILTSVALTNGSANFATSSLTLGSHTITVSYAGDSTHSPSPSATLVEQIQQSTSTTIASSGSPVIVGAPVTFTAAVTGASVTPTGGVVAFYDGATLLGSSSLNGAGLAAYQTSSLVAGTHLILASYQGDANDRASVSTAVSQAINTADTTVTLTSSANPSVVGTAVTFSAGVVSRGQPATGVVTFLDGSVVLGTTTVTSGRANLTINSLAAGLHAIIARYGGDTGTQVSTSVVLLQVARQHTSAVLVSSLNPMLTAESLTLAATVANGSSPTGTFSFFDGAVSLGTASVSSSGTAAITVPSLSAGTHSLSVSYSGDSYNLPSNSNSVPEIVQLRPSTTSMTASSQGYLDGQQVTLVAVVHYVGPVVPTGTVTFTANGQILGTSNVSTAAAATLTLDPTASKYDIIATYNGDAVYSASTAGDYTITKGTSTTFTLTTDRAALSLKSGDHQKLTLTLATSGSFSDTLLLGCLNLPPEATCTFSSNETKLAAGGISTITVVVDTGNPLGSGAGTTASLKPSRSGVIITAALWGPAALLFSILLVRARRGRRLTALLPLLLLALTGLTATGCGNKLNTTTTPAGAYTVRIIATGAHTGISQITDIVVTVQ